jgi:dTDP-4-dehydrorhamnose reductase
MLGRDLTAALAASGAGVLGLSHAGLDVTDAAAVDALITDYRPGIVVNCAAWTAVDDAEDQEAAAHAVNGAGAAHLAAACARTGASMVQISTDYVFDGLGHEPYGEDATPAPRTGYGRTKLAGEQAVLRRLPGTGLIVRTAWLYGGRGPSFVHTMIKRASAGDLVEVVADQCGQPTWTADVAAQVIALAGAGAHGIYHATSSGQTSWFGLAAEVFRLCGADLGRVRPTSSEAYPRPAPRPAYSVLGHGRHAEAGLPPIGHWRPALRRAWPALAQDRPGG